MKSDIAKIVSMCALVVCMVSLVCSPVAASGEYRVLDDQCVVLLEKCTGTWCPPCGSVSPIIDEIWDSYGSTQLAIIEYHNGASSGGYYDPFAFNASNQKVTDLGVSGLPTVFIDGGSKMVGGNEITKTACENAINTRLAIMRDFTITVTGDVTTGSIDVTLDQPGSSSATDTKLRYVVVESDKYYTGGTDPDNTYHHICRAILPEDSITLPLSGPVSFTKDFTIDGSWSASKLSVVAYLQSASGANEVYQACFYGYGGSAVYEFNPTLLFPAIGIIAMVSVVAFRKKTVSF
jgi:hypothetical protein